MPKSKKTTLGAVAQTRTEKLNAGPDVVSQRPPPESVDLQNLDPTIAYTRAKPLGQLRTYGILVGTIHDGEINLNGKPLRYEIWVKADADYRIAIDVQSVDGSDLLVFFDPDFANPTKLDLPTRAAGPKGFTPLATGREGQGLDYLRDALFPLGSMASAPAEGQGNSLANLLDAQIGRAKEDDDAVVLVCGELFRDNGADPTFAFSPEQGLHDIHMMQGNGGSFADDNRVNGDGALFIRYGNGETVALFLRFSVQDFVTNDQSGAPE